jgi:hypothetical protein
LLATRKEFKIKFTDDLKKIYAQEGKLHNFFDSLTPTDLYRGRKTGLTMPFLQPTMIGWPTQTDWRPPDVLAQDDQGKSPQYADGNPAKEPLTEDRQKMPLTSSIIANADKYIVKGCRTSRANDRHRGVSTFDQMNPRLKSHVWMKLPADTEIPPGLAVTRDEKPGAPSGTPVHHTIAPKDDMPLALFLQYLKVLEAKSKLL